MNHNKEGGADQRRLQFDTYKTWTILYNYIFESFTILYSFPSPLSTSKPFSYPVIEKNNIRDVIHNNNTSKTTIDDIRINYIIKDLASFPKIHTKCIY